MLEKKVGQALLLGQTTRRRVLVFPANEFRITVEPGGKSAKSPTIHCGPDLTRTPKRSANKKVIALRAPTLEMKAVWQNLLQRQM